ncbi:MAG: hypothetical protein H0W44_05170 [Gammaproteobacteria bacterium]|nr:hypothetical protein [Gammaproteobacteria bacterium]
MSLFDPDNLEHNNDILLQHFTQQDVEKAKQRLLTRFRVHHGLLISLTDDSIITPDDLETFRSQAGELADQETKTDLEIEQLKILTVLTYVLMEAGQSADYDPVFDPDSPEAQFPYIHHYIIRKLQADANKLSYADIEELIVYENRLLRSLPAESHIKETASLNELCSADGRAFILVNSANGIALQAPKKTKTAPKEIQEDITTRNADARSEAALDQSSPFIVTPTTGLPSIVLKDETAALLIDNLVLKAYPSGIKVAASSYVGKGRTHNEDASVLIPSHDQITVIDGMGGYGNGVAMRDVFVEHLLKNPGDIQATALATQIAYDEMKVPQGGVCVLSAQVRRENQFFKVHLSQAGDVHALLVDNTGDVKYESVDEAIGHQVINAIIARSTTESHRVAGWHKFGVLTETHLFAKRGWRLAIYSDGVGNHLKKHEVTGAIINCTLKQAVAQISDLIDSAMQKTGAYCDNASIAIIEF